MTKYDFRIRRGVFRSGSIRTHRDFQRFEKDFHNRKRSASRLRNLIFVIAIIIITTILLFTFRGLSAAKDKVLIKHNNENTTQLLRR